jgi:hypothetical protein
MEKGQGDPLVLLHGNGSMVQDFISSGLIDLAAENYRVIAFDQTATPTVMEVISLASTEATRRDVRGYAVPTPIGARA